jgi:hypothetical protein
MDELKLHKLNLGLLIKGEIYTIQYTVAEFPTVDSFIEKLKLDNEEYQQAQKLLVNKDSKVFESSWDFFGDLSLLSHRDKVAVVLNVIKGYDKVIGDFKAKAKVNDYIITKPKWGNSPLEATKRQFLSTRFNLSEIKEDGLCYGFCNEEYKIQPL